MRQFWCLFLLMPVLVVTGCASKITRYGYSVNTVQGKSDSNCNVPIKKNFHYVKEEVDILGEILSGDSGVSIDCGQGYVMKLFRKEACGLKADLINITYERNIDLWSSCYRAKAQFLRFKDREKAKNLQSDYGYR